MPLHDLNQAQLRTLRALAKEKQPIPVAELAEKLDASRGTSEVAGYQATDEIRYLVTGR